MQNRKKYWLHGDISRCANSQCPLKENCKRWLDNPPSDGTKYFYISKFEPDEGGICEYQIKLDEKALKLYRIQSLTRESLWYTFDGKYKDRLETITGQSIPMPWEEMRQANPKEKLLSSVEDINMFPNWFNKDQIEKLFNSGYSLYEYEVEKGIYLPKGEILFDYNKVESMREVMDMIYDVKELYKKEN